MPEGKTINKVYYKYYSGTTQETRNAVKSTVAEFQKRVGKNGAFINGYTFSVVNEYKDLNPDTPFKKYLKENSDNYTYTFGASNPTVIDEEKGIIIQAKEHSFPRSLFHRNIESKLIETAALHEIGHNFDNYYGLKDENIVREVRKLHFSDKNITKKQQNILNQYSRNKDLSDSKEFKQAWLKDATALGKDKNKYYEFKMDKIRRYYAIEDIDITDEITKQEIENADKSRSEIFAQLFAYALGKDDGRKKEIIKAYPNTYNVVKAYIKKYLNISV